MLAEKLMKMTSHHLQESKEWGVIRKKCREKHDLFGEVYAMRKELAHHDMCMYFYDLTKSVHYVRGTWREVCGHRK